MKKTELIFKDMDYSKIKKSRIIFFDEKISDEWYWEAEIINGYLYKDQNRKRIYIDPVSRYYLYLGEKNINEITYDDCYVYNFLNVAEQEILLCKDAYIYPVNTDLGRYRKFGYILRKKNGDRLFHLGHDFDCNLKTPVYAMTDGIVIISRNDVSGFGGYELINGKINEFNGGMILIQSNFDVNNKIFHIYGHIDNITVTKNSKVRRGDLLGYVSNYYVNSENIPHLHFCVYINKNQPLSPYGYLDINKLNKNWVDPLEFIPNIII